MRPGGGASTALAVTLLTLGVALFMNPGPEGEAQGASGAPGYLGGVGGLYRAAFHVTGPPPGHTGGFGEPTCLECHTGSPLNAYGGSIRVEGLPDVLEGGRAYLLTVTLRADDTTAAGFQISSRFSEGGTAGLSAGEFRSVDDRVTVTIDTLGRAYAHHTENGIAVVESGGSSWALEWFAPETGGPVVFHLTGNSANGDNSPLGDLIFAETVRAKVYPLGRP